MTRQVLPPSESPEVAAMVDIKEHLLNRFQLSQFYQEQRGSKEITRYTDKYRFERQSEPFETGKVWLIDITTRILKVNVDTF